MQAVVNTNFATLQKHVLSIDEDYEAVTVAWNDGQRGVLGGMLSCWGGNITDVRLVAEDGGVLPFVRPDNMNETLGITTADKIMFVERDGTQLTAQEVLVSLEQRAKYMGYTSVKTNVKDPEKVVVRVQNIWIPLNGDGAERKFVPSHFSYQTWETADPRNLIVLGTPSGTYVHADAMGMNHLYSHTDDGEGVNNHWFTAKESDLDVGNSLGDESDRTTAPEKKGRFVEIGLKGLGKRANCFVVMSIPNVQKIPRVSSMSCYRSISSCDAECNGVSKAAIVSADTTNVVSKASKNCIDIVRANDEPIVITLMMYNTVKAPPDQLCSQVIISREDVERSIHDMKKIYDMCDTKCKLSQLPVMLSKLMSGDQNKSVDECSANSLPFHAPTFVEDPFKPDANALAYFK